MTNHCYSQLSIFHITCFSFLLFLLSASYLLFHIVPDIAWHHILLYIFIIHLVKVNYLLLKVFSNSLIRIIINLLPNSHYHNSYTDPFLAITTKKVFSIIFISSPKLQFIMYSLSSFTISSKSVISLRPLICHIPVSPGFVARRLL